MALGELCDQNGEPSPFHFMLTLSQTILCRVQAAGGTTRAALGELCDEGGTPSPSSLFSMAQGPSDPLPHGEISLTPSRRRRAQAPSLIDAARVGYPRSYVSRGTDVRPLPPFPPTPHAINAC